MNNNVRYLWNWGLAFDETRILKRFEELSEEGWFLESMTTFRYRLSKGAPSRLRYAMDYRRLQAEEEADYYAIFEEEGWKSVCSLQGFHFFSAAPESVAIHTEQATKQEKYSGFQRVCFLSMLISGVGLMVLWLLGQIDALDFLGWGEPYAMAILLAVAATIFVPSLMMSVAYWIRMRKIRLEGDCHD